MFTGPELGRRGDAMDVPMELSRILITEYGNEQVIFLKEKDGQRSFPIVIGSVEAMAIDRRLKGQDAPRPMTHDLLADVIGQMGGQIDKIVIDDLHDHTFTAKLYISCGRDHICVDSRPSDAIALGVAFDTPIFVAETVLDEVFRQPATAEDRIDFLRQRMRMLDDRMTEISDRLEDETFLATASEEVVEEHRRSLGEMQSEYDAIDGVLKKLS